MRTYIKAGNNIYEAIAFIESGVVVDMGRSLNVLAYGMCKIFELSPEEIIERALNKLPDTITKEQ